MAVATGVAASAERFVSAVSVPWHPDNLPSTSYSSSSAWGHAGGSQHNPRSQNRASHHHHYSNPSQAQQQSMVVSALSQPSSLSCSPPGLRSSAPPPILHTNGSMSPLLMPLVSSLHSWQFSPGAPVIAPALLAGSPPSSSAGSFYLRESQRQSDSLRSPLLHDAPNYRSRHSQRTSYVSRRSVVAGYKSAEQVESTGMQDFTITDALGDVRDGAGNRSAGGVLGEFSFSNLATRLLPWSKKADSGCGGSEESESFTEQPTQGDQSDGEESWDFQSLLPWRRKGSLPQLEPATPTKSVTVQSAAPASSSGQEYQPHLPPPRIESDNMQPKKLDPNDYRIRQQPGTRGVKPRPFKKVVGPVPVYVMLPLDVVGRDGTVMNVRAMEIGLQALKAIGVDGVMADVWWGIVEREGPGVYDFKAYLQLLDMVKAAGLKMQVVMSFHSCGGNVGDTVDIPLPKWVLDAGAVDPNIFYTDRMGHRNLECISLFSDHAPVLAGRSPMQCYADFMKAFRDAFWENNRCAGTLVEVSVGMGPCGELRYPAYPEQGGRWQFPGIGEFQCYDKRAMADLEECALAAGHTEWALSGPHDAGSYNDFPLTTGFFHERGSWESDYGRFFLTWYSGALLRHSEDLITVARSVFSGRHEVALCIKCAGVHWWYNTRSHAAELTAGYYNTRERNGYLDVVELCAKHGAHLKFTCVEMRDLEHPAEARCGPEGLLRQVRLLAAAYGVEMSGENALCRYDQYAYDSILHNVYGSAFQNQYVMYADGSREVAVPRMASFTFLRMEQVLFEDGNFPLFGAFVRRMKAGGWAGRETANDVVEKKASSASSSLSGGGDRAGKENFLNPVSSSRGLGSEAALSSTG